MITASGKVGWTDPSEARVVTIGVGTLQQAERDAYEAGQRAAERDAYDVGWRAALNSLVDKRTAEFANLSQRMAKLTRHVETAIALLKSGDPVRAWEVLDKAHKEARR